MLCSDKFGFTPLTGLSHRSEVSFKALKSTKSHYNTNESHTPFLTGHYPLVLITRLIFSTISWTLADHIRTFIKMRDPQGECILLREKEFYLPEIAQ